MTGRLGMTGDALGYGNREFGKAAPKRTPFLHPKARPFHQGKVATRQMANSRMMNDIVDASAGKMTAAVRAGRNVAAGPSAPAKTRAALSGKDYGETLSRLGRATRRQNKEFSAIVHPLSGRVMDMRRGNAGSVGMGVGRVAAAGRPRSRMAELAENAKNPVVRERAKANLMGENKNLTGPQAVLVHNHPRFDHHYGTKGKHAVRSYPSTPDRMFAAAMPNSRHVVLSHAPDGPAGRKTKAVTSRIVDRDRGLDAYSHEQLAHQDVATIPKGRARRALIPDKGERRSMGNQIIGSRGYSAKNKKGKLRSYDDQHRRRTGNVKNARTTGLYTTESFLKVDTTMSEDEAARLAARYDTRGPLPKTMSREQKMKAYEARYIAAGGRKGEKWKRRADRAEVVRNVGLVGATVSTAGLLASRGRRTGPKMARLKVTPHRAETGAMGSAVLGGSAELYGEHARNRRASYANSPAGVAGSALSRMQAYTPGRKS